MIAQGGLAMHVHPDVARLRSAPALQLGCDAALAAWRALPDVAAAIAALARFDAGEQLGTLPALASIVCDAAAARAFADRLIAPLIAALRAEPLAQLPLGYSAAPGMARLRLASHGRTGLTLTVFAQRARAVSPTALFEDCMAHEMVVAGTGRALVHRLDQGQLTTAEVACEPGTRMTRTGPQDARQIIAVTRPLLLLQLTQAAAHPAPSREIALADARVIMAISGCKRSSQQMMALGVLGALAHRPALTELELLARDLAAQRELRWEAVRQVLALDAARGLALIGALAGSRADTLAVPAAALQQQLLAAQPDLAALLPVPA